MRTKGTSVAGALAHLHTGTFALAARRAGESRVILVRWAQPCSESPPMLSVAVRKGRPIELLIRDARSFSLNLLSGPACPIALFLRHADEHARDLLDTLAHAPIAKGAPCLDAACVNFDCEVVRQIDLDESDHGLYVGMVVAARVAEVARSTARPSHESDNERRASARTDKPPTRPRRDDPGPARTGATIGR